MGRQGHPQLRALGAQRRRRWHGRTDQGLRRATAPCQQTEGQQGWQSTATRGGGGQSRSGRRHGLGGPAGGASDGLRP